MLNTSDRTQSSNSPTHRAQSKDLVFQTVYHCQEQGDVTMPCKDGNTEEDREHISNSQE